MIIFDLDGTLADCDHRRHFVDPRYNKEYQMGSMNGYKIGNGEPFKPDWKSFYEACDKDTPIEPVISALQRISPHEDVQIWSGRCESQRYKTHAWLFINGIEPTNFIIKMRPIGDNTPDDVLKERWLDEELAKGNKIDFVFDDRKKVRDMWIKRGIFVFNCAQHDKEF